MNNHCSSTRLLRTRLWWGVGGRGVVVSLVGLWASGWQGQQVGEPSAAIADRGAGGVTGTPCAASTPRA